MKDTWKKATLMALTMFRGTNLSILGVMRRSHVAFNSYETVGGICTSSGIYSSSSSLSSR